MAFSGNFVLGIPQLRTANPETNLRRYCFVVSDNRKALFRKFPIRNKSREFASGLVSCREHENDSNPCVIEEKLIKEVTEVISGVDINVKLTSLGGRRRRISVSCSILRLSHEFLNVAGWTRYRSSSKTSLGNYDRL